MSKVCFKKLNIYTVLCFIILIISCVSIRNVANTNEDVNFEINFLETEAIPVKGVILLAHGLNTKPLKMGDNKTEGSLAKLFLDEGYHVYRIALSGHYKSIEEMQNIKAKHWINSALSQYYEALEIANNLNIPIYLVAFSLGALVYKNILNSEENVKFSGSILFAPALTVKGTVRFSIYLGNIFLHDETIISSKAPVEYRAQKDVSMSAYNALFELVDNLHEKEFANCNIPTLIFIDPKDELISISKLKNIITRFTLTNWNISEVTTEGSTITPKYHHLIIDNKCVSTLTWEKIKKEIIFFLRDL
jgi:esterase/lipase